MEVGLDKPGRSTLTLPRLALIVLGLSAVCVSACLYDADDRCRGGRVLSAGLCVCPPDTSLMGEQCVAKMAAPKGLGVACDTATHCEDETFSVCKMTAADEGYCTKEGCADDAECGGDYYCAKDASPAYCKHLPTGTDVECSSDDDCAEFDANYCAPANLEGVRLCVVAHCTENSCAPGLKCQDISKYRPGTPPLCIAPLPI